MRAISPDSTRRNAGLGSALLFFAALAVFCLASAESAEHEVRTRGVLWVPTILFIEPGDAVVWLGMNGHETELIEGMGPEDAMLWRSELNEDGFKVTFVKPGAYIYKCNVHLSAGMLGAIVVGDGEPNNLDEIDAAVALLGEERASVERVIRRLKGALERR